MFFNSLTTFSLSSSFVAQSNSFIKLLKFLPLLYSLRVYHQRLPYILAKCLYSRLFFYLLLFWYWYWFFYFLHLHCYHYLAICFVFHFCHFHFHFYLLDFLILMFCQLKLFLINLWINVIILSVKGCTFYILLFLGFLFHLMCSNLLLQIFH